MQSAVRKQHKKSRYHNQISNAADVAVSLRHTLQDIDHQQKDVQWLRARARNRNKDRNTTFAAFAAALSGLFRLLQQANFAGELGQEISAHIGNIESLLQDAEAQDIDIDELHAALEPAEKKLKQTEIGLYEQVLWPLHQSESDGDTIQEGLSATSDEQRNLSTTNARHHDLPMDLPSTIHVDSQTREEALMPLESMQTDILQIMFTQNQEANPIKQGERPRAQFRLDVNQTGQFPPYMESLVAGPLASEDRPLSNAADRLSRLRARKRQAEARLNKAHQDLIVLQEDAKEREAVGAAPDIDSQEYIRNFSGTRDLLQKQLAEVDSEILICQQDIDLGKAQAFRVSQIFFHMDQFTNTSTTERPPELIIDNDEDLEAQWVVFEALASDLWPVSTTIRYPKYAKSWVAMTLAIMRTQKELLYAYVSFWLLKCIQASWLSFSRFIYYHYLDDVFAPNYKSIKRRLLRSWFDTNLTISLRRTQKLSGDSLRLVKPPPLDNSHNGKAEDHINKSRWSVRAQPDANTQVQRTASRQDQSIRRSTQSPASSLRRWKSRKKHTKAFSQ